MTRVPARKSQSVIPFCIQLLIGIGLLVFIVSRIDVSQVVILLKSSRKVWLALGWVTVLSVYYTRATVIQILARPEAEISSGRLFILNLVGSFFSNFLPSRAGGDLVKGLYLARHFHSRSKAYATLVVQRTVGIAATLAVSLCASVIVLKDFQFVGLVIVITLAAVLLFGVLNNLKTLSDLCLRMAQKSFGARRLLLVTNHFLESIRVASSNRKKITCLFLFSALITLQGVFATWLVGIALQTTLSFRDVLLCSSLSQLSALIPITPAGLGIGEGTFVGAGISVGVPKEEAFAVIIIVRAILISISILGGSAYLIMPLSLNSGGRLGSDNEQHPPGDNLDEPIVDEEEPV